MSYVERDSYDLALKLGEETTLYQMSATKLKKILTPTVSKLDWNYEELLTYLVKSCV